MFKKIYSRTLTVGGCKTTFGEDWPGEGTIVSAGFQNMGNATALYMSQFFITPKNTLYFQIVNNSMTSTDFKLTYVVYLPGNSDDIIENNNERSFELTEMPIEN